MCRCFFLLFAYACTSSGEPECDTGGLDVRVSDAPGASTWVSEDLTLTGTAYADGAIDWIEVGGVRVEDTESNFTRWTVKLPVETLRAFDGPSVSLPVEAWLHCDDSVHTFTSVPIQVEPEEGVPVEGLALVATLPAGCYAPLDGSAAVELTVCADASSASGTADLSVSSGTLGTSTLTLEASDEATCPTAETGAAARTWFTPTTAGEVGVVASAWPSLPVRETLRVAGPPVFSPAELTLAVGDSASLSLTTGGTLQECRLTGVDGALAAVAIDGVAVAPIVDFAPAADCSAFTPDPSRTIQLTAGSTGSTMASLTCVDVYGQAADLTVTISE